MRIFVFSGLAVLALALHSGQAPAAEDDVSEGIITVSASAALDVGADLATLAFGVDTEAPTAAAALAANSDRMNAIVEAIRNAGLDQDEISTAQFKIAPVYETTQARPGETAQQTLKGYRVSNLLNVSTEKLDAVARIVDVAVAAGANRVDRISFDLSRELLESNRERLIGQAVEKARSKAMLALGPLGYEITGVKNVSVADRAQPRPMYAENVRMNMAVSSAPPVFAGEQAVTAAVTVTFLIGSR